MKRTIQKAFQGIPVINDDEITLYRSLPTNLIESLGPFVMDSRENIIKAFENYESGNMGKLN